MEVDSRGPTDPDGVVASLQHLPPNADGFEVARKLKALENYLSNLPEEGRHVLQLLPTLVKSKNAAVAEGVTRILAQQSSRKDAIVHLNAGGIFPVLTSVLKDGHVAADHACTVLANLVDNSNDRTFQFLGVDGVTHMLKLLDYQKPRQVGILVLVARLIPQVPMDALERIASSPALQSFFKAFSENKLHDIVACITLVILRLFAKCGSRLSPDTTRMILGWVNSASEMIADVSDLVQGHLCDTLREWLLRHRGIIDLSFVERCALHISRSLLRGKGSPSDVPRVLDLLALLCTSAKTVRETLNRKLISSGILEALIRMLDGQYCDKSAEMIIQLQPSPTERVAFGNPHKDVFHKLKDSNAPASPLHIVASLFLDAMEPPRRSMEQTLLALKQDKQHLRSCNEIAAAKVAVASSATSQLVAALREANLQLTRSQQQLLEERSKLGLAVDERAEFERTIRELHQSLVQKSNHIDLLTQELSQVKPLSEVAAIVASGASEPPSKKRKTTDDDFVDVKALQAQLETLSQEKADIASAFESYREKATTEINQLQADKKDLAEELAAVKTAFAAKSSALSSDATLKLKQELEETKKQLSASQSQVKNLQNDNSQLKKAKEKLFKDMSSMQKTINTLTDHVEMDSKELKAIVNGYSRHLEVYDETRAASNTLSSRFAVLKAELERVDSNEREAKRLTDENKRLRDKLRAAETEAESKKKAVSAFEKQIEELQRRLQTQLPQLSHAPPYQGPSAPVYQPVDDDDELPDLDL